jgi:diphthine-ammonia ligase
MYASSWSGGKDGCLATYRAIRQGLPVGFLLNTIADTYQRVRFHGTPKDFIHAQADALGLELLQWPTPDESYEDSYLAALLELKGRGVTGMVFGDIFPAANRDWGVRMCEAAGLEAVHPIYGLDTQDVMAEFLAAGFEAVIVSGRPDIFSGEQMGMRLGPEFLEWAARQPGLDVCGENGEYHTIVVDGPLFARRIEITDAAPVQVNGHWFLDVRDWELGDKAHGS